MRKKLLSLLLSLTLVLGLLPATALAAELADLLGMGFTQKQIDEALIVEEDTELPDTYEGLVIITKAGVTVRIKKGAKLTTGVVIAPGAADAKVVLEADSDVNAVILLDAAKVEVQAQAKAEMVAVAAPKAEVAVAGQVSSVTVMPQAEGASVTVEATASVNRVTAAAPAASVAVAENAAVTSITVAETASGASVAVAEGASVTSVSVAAPNTSVDVDGSVGRLNVAESATGATLTAGANANVTVSGAGAENVNVSGAGAENVTTAPVVSGDDGGDDAGSEDVPGTTPDDHPVVPSAGIIPAPLADHAQDGAISPEELVKNGSYSVMSPQIGGEKIYDVVIHAEELKQHTNAANPAKQAYWIGIGIPVKEGTAYKIFALTVNTGEKKSVSELSSDKGWTEVTSAEDRFCTDAAGNKYNTVYFEVSPAGTGDLGGGKSTVIAVQEVKNTSNEGVATAADLEPEDVLEYLYVSFTGSVKSGDDITPVTDTPAGNSGTTTPPTGQQEGGEKVTEETATAPTGDAPETVEETPAVVTETAAEKTAAPTQETPNEEAQNEEASDETTPDTDGAASESTETVEEPVSEPEIPESVDPAPAA